MVHFTISMFGIFLTCLISILEITAKDANTALFAVQIGYIGRLISVIFLFKFILLYCHLTVPKWLDKCMILVNVLVVAIVFSTQKTGLFYREYSISRENGFSCFHVTPGPFYYAVMVEIYAISIFAFMLVMKKRAKREAKETKDKYTLLSICILNPMIGLILYLLVIRGGFDLLPCSLAISSILFFISMRNQFLFDVAQKGKEYVLDHASEGILIVDNHYRIVYYNEKAKILDENLYIGAKAKEEKVLVHLDNRKEVQIKERTFDFNFSKVYREDGELAIYLMEAKDITDYHLLRENLKNAKLEAEKASQTKSEFLANMSHEIRTPINAIIGMNEMILRENTNPVIDEYASSIQKAGNALLSLINDILNLSKIESGKVESSVSEYDTNELLYSLKKMLETAYPGKEVHHKVIINQNIPKRLYGDMNRITQLVMNAVSNASQYMEEGETVIRFEYQPKIVTRAGLQIYSELERKQEKYPEIWLQLCIDDIGSQITREVFEHILNDLNPEEMDEKKQFEREELKPAIVSKMMKSMDAKLYMNLDDEGNFTTTLSIPQGVIDETPIGQEEVKEGTGKNQLFTAEEVKVLVVDDNPVNLKVIVSLLKRTHIQVDVAHSGQECLEAVQNVAYDLIFMDHLMPEMDGIETLHHIRESQNHKCLDTPVIILTANGVTGAREFYMKEGFSDYLMKPVMSVDLESSIKRYVDSNKIHYCEEL